MNEYVDLGSTGCLRHCDLVLSSKFGVLLKFCHFSHLWVQSQTAFDPWVEWPSNRQTGHPGGQVCDENDWNPDCPGVFRWRKKVYSNEAQEESLQNGLNDRETHPGEDCLGVPYDGAVDEEDGVDERHGGIDEDRTAKE